MTNISLRTYQRKIEHLIEDKSIGQALFHCHELLLLYPKNYHIYQLASRALLDFGNLPAADIGFDILLQIEPDDFVAHIGKSMIAESKGLLEKSISHIKHAFEIQPANEGLQEEIRRLLEKKDSISPNKVILTRGALIKMYMRGKLYDQAIGEIMIGLDESPNRVDYKLSLAESLMETGKTIQAVEISLEIIKRLPYCLRSNEMLHKAFKDKTQEQGNDVYLYKLTELDPFYAYMLPTTPSVLDVPDIAVTIEEKIPSEHLKMDIDWEEFMDRQWELPAPSEIQIEANLDEIIQKITDPSFGLPFQNSKYNQDQDGKMEPEEFEGIYEPHNGLVEDDNSKRTAFVKKLKGYTEIPVPDSQSDLDKYLNVVDFEPELDGVDDPGRNQGDFSSESTRQVFESEGLAELTSDLMDEEHESIWVADEEEIQVEVLDSVMENQIPSEKNVQEKLHDTQPINISSMDPELIIQEAEKAINGGNFKYALQLFHPLIEKNLNLEEISRYLENAVEQYPDKTNFLLLLGEVYTRMENREKALEIFQKAQNLISL